jgi:uncharacterized membrane protein
MKTPASIRNHPVHPMLIVFPIALWVFSLVCDIAYHVGSHNEFWQGAAFYSIAGGIAGAILAAIPGFIDYLSLTNRSVKKTATTHMVINLIVVALFLFNLGVRYNARVEGQIFALALSLVGISLMCVSGWLGGTMVYEGRVGVSERQEPENERRVA